jgi:hypothetical protein
VRVELVVLGAELARVELVVLGVVLGVDLVESVVLGAELARVGLGELVLLIVELSTAGRINASKHVL